MGAERPYPDLAPRYKQNIDASPIADDPIRARPDQAAPVREAKIAKSKFFCPQVVDIP
jgi:hypothetical protein